ncbi:MAG: hypothetical protein Aurels2KO_08260 [Aureliella sp.]
MVQMAQDTDLESIDLPANGKRAAVLTLTARRHAGLLDKLKNAKTDEDKKEAESALRENYQRHYAIETWWRQQKLKKLEEELAALKAQVQKRVDSEEKYVEAAMTIAQLHIDGVSITPPVPAAPRSGGELPPSAPGGPYYGGSGLPMRGAAAPDYGRFPSEGGTALPPTTRYLDSKPNLPKPALPLESANLRPSLSPAAAILKQ